MTRSSRGPLPLADLTARECEHLELCVHEGVQSVAGVALSAQLRSAVVTKSKVMGLEGLTTFEPTDFPSSREAKIAYSGVYGQAKFRAGGHRRPTQREVFSILSRGGYKDERTLIAAGGTHLGQFVTPLVDRCWPAIIRTAQTLYKTGEVTQADVLAALGITDGGGRTSSQLANIRAGLRSVQPIADPTRPPVPA